MTEQELLAFRPFAAWSRGQALAMIAALFACAFCRAGWPIAASATPAFLCLIWLGRRAFSPSGRFGFANAITALRLGLVLLLSAELTELSAPQVLTLVCSVLALDLLDGWLARRLGDASAFGAHFDMETDALLVLVLVLRLWLTEGFAIWILLGGLLRYLYVSWLWVCPGSGREAPRSRLGRYAFVLLMLGLCAGLLLPQPWGHLCAAFGTLVVSWSFARSFYFSTRSA